VSASTPWADACCEVARWIGSRRLSLSFRHSSAIPSRRITGRVNGAGSGEQSASHGAVMGQSWGSHGAVWGSHGPAMGQYGHVEEVGMVIRTWNARRVATACLRAAHVPRDGLGSRCAPFELTEYVVHLKPAIHVLGSAGGEGDQPSSGLLLVLSWNNPRAGALCLVPHLFPHPGGLRRGACSHTRCSFDFSDGSKQRANRSDR
jgi:hypothetical protein